MGTFNFQSLDIYRVAKEVAVLVQGSRIRDAELRDQATRAAKSAFLNLAEGLPSNQTAFENVTLLRVRDRSVSFAPRLISHRRCTSSMKHRLGKSKPTPNGS